MSGRDTHRIRKWLAWPSKRFEAFCGREMEQVVEYDFENGGLVYSAGVLSLSYVTCEECKEEK